MDDTEISQLRWRCRRGMRELDKLTEYYLNQYYRSASESECSAFRRLLDLSDPEILALVLDRTDPADEDTQLILDKMRKRT